MVTKNCKINGATPVLIRRIRDLINLSWHIQVNHTLREGNRCADCFFLYLVLLPSLCKIIVSAWYYISIVGNMFESYFISYEVFNKYKSLYIGKLRYLAIVIESEEAHQTSKVIKLLQWLYSVGVKNVCLYDMNGVLKKSKETIFQTIKNAKSIEEVNEDVTHHAPDHMTLEFVSYVDRKEAAAKAGTSNSRVSYPHKKQLGNKPVCVMTYDPSSSSPQHTRQLLCSPAAVILLATAKNQLLDGLHLAIAKPHQKYSMSQRAILQCTSERK
ncbi:unnamed protein product [Trifolium pratense]|uniref:Uncharacterized protein n=1 Tax=Trifolium pratense TaxID=57577 RepID=A0ACB0LTV5_TRIPR|nr:unnamed protein product [Trifolium pratense]